MRKDRRVSWAGEESRPDGWSAVWMRTSPKQWTAGTKVMSHSKVVMSLQEDSPHSSKATEPEPKVGTYPPTKSA